MPYSRDWREYVKNVLQGYTQAELARRVGVSQSTVSNWRHGMLPVDSAVVRRVAEAAERDPDELEQQIHKWTISTALQANYSLTERETRQIQEVLDLIIRERKVRRG
ncbi:MAG: helix-turn-helix domain-containing protein [Armatimonadota bacterium]